MTTLSRAVRPAVVLHHLGGGAGSTAGGIKLLRLLMVMYLIRWWVQRSGLSPHAQSPVRFTGRTWFGSRQGSL
jgi:Trk-type K+ transport system membrane component